MKKCPLKIIKKKLGRKYIKKIIQIEKKINLEVNKAFNFAKKSKLPDKKLIDRLVEKLNDR